MARAEGRQQVCRLLRGWLGKAILAAARAVDGAATAQVGDVYVVYSQPVVLTPFPNPPRTPSTLASMLSQYLTPFSKSGPGAPFLNAEPTFDRARLESCCRGKRGGHVYIVIESADSS